MTRKLLALFLSAVMLISAAALSAAAEEDVTVTVTDITEGLSPLQKAVNAAPDGKRTLISLDADVKGLTAPLVIPENKDIVLDLCGHVIGRAPAPEDADLSEYQGSVIGVNGSLTLEDSVGTGTITGGYALLGGGIVIDENGRLVMNGGTVCDNYAFAGGGIYLGGGELVLNGGAVLDNASSMMGGGIIANGSFVMRGGTVAGNLSLLGGGLVIENGKARLLGGEVTGNTVLLQCAGVVVSLGDVTVGGSFRAAGNRLTDALGVEYEDNVTLAEGTVLKAAAGADAPADGFAIGFSLMDFPGLDGSVAAVTGALPADWQKYFTADKPGTALTEKDGGLYLSCLPSPDALWLALGDNVLTCGDLIFGADVGYDGGAIFTVTSGDSVKFFEPEDMTFSAAPFGYRLERDQKEQMEAGYGYTCAAETLDFIVENGAVTGVVISGTEFELETEDAYYYYIFDGDYRAPDGTFGHPWPVGADDGSFVLAAVEDNELMVWGSGAIRDYDMPEDRPWHGRAEEITSIFVDEGITRIGDNAFSGLGSGRDDFDPVYVYVSDSVKEYGAFAFYNTYLGKYAVASFDDAVRFIGSCAFGQTGVGEIMFTGLPGTIADDAFSGVSADVYTVYGVWPEKMKQQYDGRLTYRTLYMLTYEERCGDEAVVSSGWALIPEGEPVTFGPDELVGWEFDSYTVASGELKIDLKQPTITTELHDNVYLIVNYRRKAPFPGDFDGDGQVGTSDLSALRTALADGEVNTVEPGADMNGDGQIDGRDLVLLRHALAVDR